VEEVVPHDSGSTLLGLALAFLALDFYRSNSFTLPVAFFPLLVVALPLLDAALAIIRRVFHARSPLYGDRRHIYDLALSRGWSTRSVALTWYAVTLVLAAVASLALRTDSTIFMVAGGSGVALLAATAVRLGSLHHDGKLARLA
jgi:UDP-N-acetylmuramyl pentapeptide phosphotransferase/UDP-N-acetylglucosamine-1-phosphate transferase